MPSVFAGLEDQMSADVDKVFGEGFEYIPMLQATVNSRLEQDLSRTSFAFTAVIDDRSPGSTSFERLGSSSGGTASKDRKPSFTTSTPMLFFDTANFGDGTPPKRLDRVRRTETGAVYEITALEKDGFGRVKAGLVRVA